MYSWVLVLVAHSRFNSYAPMVYYRIITRVQMFCFLINTYLLKIKHMLLTHFCCMYAIIFFNISYANRRRLFWGFICVSSITENYCNCLQVLYIHTAYVNSFLCSTLDCKEKTILCVHSRYCAIIDIIARWTH